MYELIIGEVGNEIGHIVGSYSSHDAAIRAGKRAVKVYDGDGWYRVRQV